MCYELLVTHCQVGGDMGMGMGHPLPNVRYYLQALLGFPFPFSVSEEAVACDLSRDGADSHVEGAFSDLSL